VSGGGVWRALGTYRGGMRGSPPEAVGRKVNFSGTDGLRIVGGKIVEYWGGRRLAPVRAAARAGPVGTLTLLLA